MEVKEEIDLDEESHLYVDESVDSPDGDFLVSNEKHASINKPQQTKVDENQGPSPNHKKCTECGIQMLKKNFGRKMRDMHTVTPKHPKPKSNATNSESRMKKLPGRVWF